MQVRNLSAPDRTSGIRQHRCLPGSIPWKKKSGSSPLGSSQLVTNATQVSASSRPATRRLLGTGGPAAWVEFPFSVPSPPFFFIADLVVGSRGLGCCDLGPSSFALAFCNCFVPSSFRQSYEISIPQGFCVDRRVLLELQRLHPLGDRSFKSRVSRIIKIHARRLLSVHQCHFDVRLFFRFTGRARRETAFSRNCWVRVLNRFS